MIGFFKTSLLRKLAICYSAVSLAIVVLVAGTAYTLARSSLKQSLIDRLQLATSLTQHEVDQWFTLQRQDALLLSQLPDLKSKTEKLLQPDDDRDRVYLNLKEILFEIAQVKSNIKIMSIVSSQGIVLVSTDTLLEKTYQPLGHLTTYVTDLKAPINPIFYNSVITNRKAITFVTPMYGNDDRRIGYISIELDLAEIDRFIQKPNRTNQGVHTYLIGRIGSENEFINSSSIHNRVNDLQLNSLAIDSALQGKNGLDLYVNHSNIPVLGLYRWLEDKNMALIAEISQEEGFYLAEKLAQNILIIGLFFLGIVWTLIYFVSRQIVKPVLEVSEAARKIAKGDLHWRVPVLGEDEMGKLAITFNVMVDKLNQSFHELEITNQQLEVKIRDSQIANRVKSDFISQMSHELRTPLNCILGFSQVLYEDSKMSDKHKSVIQSISKSGNELLFLINDVIDLSKMGEDTQARVLTTIDIVDFLEKLQSAIAPMLRQKGLQFRYEIDNSIPRSLQIDSDFLSRILRHLLENSINFTEKGGIAITCFGNDRQGDALPSLPSLEESLNSNTGDRDDLNWLTITVEDTGCGIETSELTSLFQPFTRQAQSKGFQSGMGLGLPICQTLVQRMGGKISVESQVNLGTTITVTVPFQPIYQPFELSDRDREHNSDLSSSSTYSIVSVETIQQELCELPQSWLNSLYDACCQADDEQVVELLEDLTDRHGEISRTFSELAVNYRLDKILEILEPCIEGDEKEVQSIAGSE
ncbi:sensor histidine kinase [Roseofilum casamattae]|uniref:histidine kinase n=1 Tax=Roseofilum casamattae BLCC-M143 TaxID=3022442 RepID=A0ABT7BW27_9CYAN|nr:sensor histidine kinase [Roseofilum casamattae]MDJ1183376.1 sensor histidine kinase [Roseofilum casamattae BLCC-M143]